MDLSNAERERLTKLMEECAETIQIVSKIMLFGYDEVNALDPSGPSNRERLEQELGDIWYWKREMQQAKDISGVNVNERVFRKHKKAMQYTKYQPGSKWNG